MARVTWVRFLGVAVAIFFPSYLVEKLADQLYYSSDPAFFTISGLRLELFIVLVLLGSWLGGATLRNLKSALVTEALSLAAFILAVFYFCDPRVCFSAGIDGLEPIRLGAMLFLVGSVGACFGLWKGADRSRDVQTERWFAFAAVASLGYLPIIFTMAGTRLLWELHPWGAVSVVALSAFSGTILSAHRGGERYPALLPLAGIAFDMVLSVGIASAYFPQVSESVALIAAAAVVGAIAGSGFAKSPPKLPSSGRWGSRLLVVSLILVLSMTLVVIPDAVSGLEPSPGGTGAAMGTPVYVGAYENALPGHADGAAVTVDFSSVDSGLIQSDNFLSAGFGVHSPGCCVDGIDYGYRFDAYLFRGGGESLGASAWEICDDNAACGGHSWKVLMFSQELDLTQPQPSVPLRLQMQWEGGAVLWSYSEVANGSSQPHSFASYSAPAVENRYFNVGVVQGGSVFTSQQEASYFIQFGIMSRYPIGGTGWSATFQCPSILVSGEWNCVGHAATLQGGSSYWKVLWRWGEDYQNAVVAASNSTEFTVSGSTRPGSSSFVSLW